MKPVQMIMTRINGKYFTASDLSCAYHQVPLSPETQKLTSFVIGGKQYTYQLGFYGLCGLPQWFSRIMAINVELLIKKKKAITYLDDSLLQSHTTAEMFAIIHEDRPLLRKRGLKAAPDKTHFFLRKVKFLGHVISEHGIQPVAKRVKDQQNLKFPASKRDAMKILGCLSFYSCYIKNLRVDSQPFKHQSKILLLLNGPNSTKNFLKKSKLESPRTLYWQCLQPNTLSTYTSTRLISEPVEY